MTWPMPVLIDDAHDVYLLGDIGDLVLIFGETRDVCVFVSSVLTYI